MSADGMKVRGDDNVFKGDISGTTVPLPTGAATAAKQLADGHNVTANAGTNLNTSALATSAKQLADGHNVTANAGTNLNTSALATSAKQLPDNHQVTANAGTNLNTSALATSAKQLPDNHQVTANAGTNLNTSALATSAKQLADNHQVTANAGTNLNTSALALSADQGKWRGVTSGLTTWKEADGKPRVSSMPYQYDIAEGNVTGHAPWSKVGYNPAVTTALEDVWSSTGVYAFPAAAIQMEVDSTDNDDRGLVLYGNAEGANQTTLCDVCTATTFVDGDVNFANVEVGDCILISPKGTTPQWGYVTDVTNKATGTLGVGGGWSGVIAGSAVPSGEAYTIVDQNGDTGAQVVKIDYLTGTYTEKTCLVCLNGTTDVAIDGPDGAAVLDKFRINSFRVIAAGTSLAGEGDLSLRAIADTPIYSFITNGYCRARNAQYTVPSGKTLYITSWNLAAATPADAQNRVCRMFIMTNREPTSNMLTGSIFYGYTEALVNGQATLEFDFPIKLREKTDIRVRAQGATGFSGPVASVMRGWLE